MCAARGMNYATSSQEMSRMHSWQSVWFQRFDLLDASLPKIDLNIQYSNKSSIFVWKKQIFRDLCRYILEWIKKSLFSIPNDTCWKLLLKANLMAIQLIPTRKCSIAATLNRKIIWREQGCCKDAGMLSECGECDFCFQERRLK